MHVGAERERGRVVPETVLHLDGVATAGKHARRDGVVERVEAAPLHSGLGARRRQHTPPQVRGIVRAAHRALEHERVRRTFRDEPLQPVGEVVRDRELSARVAALEGPDHLTLTLLPPGPLPDLHQRPSAVESQVPYGEPEQLRVAQHRHREQLEHQPMTRIHQGDDELHRVARKRPRLLVVLLDPWAMRQRSADDRVLADDTLALG